MKFLLFTILLIIFMPLPLKTSIYYSNENYYIKFYKFNIISKHKNKNKTSTNVSNNTIKNTSNKKKKGKPKRLKQLPIAQILKTINHNKFKPFLFAKGTLSYSLPDSANTAIAYGIISTFMPMMYKISSILFKTKKFKINVIPIFKDILFMEININSIIYISIGQIIYMLYLVTYSYFKEKVRNYEQ